MNDNEILFIQRFRLLNKMVFLGEASKLADLSMGIAKIIEFDGMNPVTENLRGKLSNIQSELDNQFELWRQDYFDDPKDKERISQYKKRIIDAFKLVERLRKLLGELTEIPHDNKVEIQKYIDLMMPIMESFTDKYKVMQNEFSDLNSSFPDFVIRPQRK